MNLRDDIDPATTWVTSDSHFGHDNIVGFCHRPEDHEQAMIAEWRAAVPDDATVLHLGDLSYRGNARFKALLARELTGSRKLLIRGNHDGQRFSFYRDCGFKVTRPFEIEYGAGNFIGPRTQVGTGAVASVEQKPYIVSFSHYPWNRNTEGVQPPNTWRVHGHIHNNGYTRDGYVPFVRHHINLSVEQTRYRPVNLKLLLDAAVLGQYPETTDEQYAEAQARKEANRAE